MRTCTPTHTYALIADAFHTMKTLSNIETSVNILDKKLPDNARRCYKEMKRTSLGRSKKGHRLRNLPQTLAGAGVFKKSETLAKNRRFLNILLACMCALVYFLPAG